MKKIAYIGVDYHLHVLALAVMIETSKTIYEAIRLKNHDKLISKYLKKLSEQFDLRMCYEPPLVDILSKEKSCPGDIIVM